MYEFGNILCGKWKWLEYHISLRKLKWNWNLIWKITCFLNLKQGIITLTRRCGAQKQICGSKEGEQFRSFPS